MQFASSVALILFFPPSGRHDYRNSGNRDGHPSGLPRPYAGGRGRGRGSYNSRGNSSNDERQDSGYSAARWGSVAKDGDDGLSNFGGAKVQNSPGREAFPGGWGSVGSGGGSGWGGGGSANDNAGWGHGAGGASDAERGGSGWGSGPKKSENGWSGNTGSGGGW